MILILKSNNYFELQSEYAVGIKWMLATMILKSFLHLIEAIT